MKDAEAPEEVGANVLPRITITELIRFLNGKGVESKCEVCGKEGWVAHEDEEMRGVGLAAVSPQGRSHLDQFLPAIAMHCTECGNMRLIVREVVADWLIQNPEADSTESDGEQGGLDV